MDDPTNHLDLESISSLNDGLMKFKGVLLFTSHDRQFLSTLANRIIHLSGSGIVDRIHTSYEEYLDNPDTQKRVKALYTSH